MRATPAGSEPADRGLLERLERYYDAAPRSGARTEEHGPFTLFVSQGRWPYYARPRLGLDAAVRAGDVDGVRERQRELGVPEALEWVVETTPSLTAASRASGLHVQELPLLVLAEPLPSVATPGSLPVDPETLAGGRRLRLVTPDEPDLARVLAVAAVGFEHGGTARGTAGPVQRDAAAADAGDDARVRERLNDGTTVMYVVEDADGPLASGAHQPVGDVSEVVGVATLPNARRQGLGSVVTRALVDHALAHGARTVFLSAAGQDVARVYRRLGFAEVAHAGIAEPPPADPAAP